MKEIFEKYDKELKAEIRKGFKDKGINASGRAANSLRADITETSYTLYGAEHILYIDKGRGAGGIPRNFHSVLLQWLKDKGLSTNEKEDRKRAGAIAYNIRTKGSSKRRGSRPETQVIEDSLNDTLPDLFKALASERAKEYKSEVLKYLKDVDNLK